MDEIPWDVIQVLWVRAALADNNLRGVATRYRNLQLRVSPLKFVILMRERGPEELALLLPRVRVTDVPRCGDRTNKTNLSKNIYLWGQATRSVAALECLQRSGYAPGGEGPGALCFALTQSKTDVAT